MTMHDSVILGSWRIAGSDLWERGDLDLLGPATVRYENGDEQTLIAVRQTGSSTAC